jgi:hypothetical protein
LKLYQCIFLHKTGHYYCSSYGNPWLQYSFIVF